MSNVVGLFDTYQDADRAVSALHQYGIEDDDISVVTRGDQKLEYGGLTAGSGAAKGAATGGIVGLLAGLGTLLVPGIGPVLATGAIASALATTLGTTAVGAGVGAAAGGLIGALVHKGVAHEDAEFYAEGVKRGGVLVSVDVRSGNEDQVAEIMRSAGSVEMESRQQSWQDEDGTKFDTTERNKDELYRR
jgi:uncharacterized membrane protein